MGAIHRQTGERDWEGVEAVATTIPPSPAWRSASSSGPPTAHRITGCATSTCPAGGRTAREAHPHDHGVVIVAGRARVTLGEEEHDVGAGDVVYVAGDELHCFEALGPEPLQFLCVSPPRRADRS